MRRIYLVKIGELSLKGANRPFFEQVLVRNLSAMLKNSSACVNRRNGRLYVSCEDAAAPVVEDALSRLAGITGWAQARKTEKTPPAVIKAAVEEVAAYAASGAKTFKIETRRTDKSFPLNSYAICCAAADAALAQFNNLKVDVHKPDAVINIEIRENAYVYGVERAGLKGLPVGTAGRGLLLLSGGIDSPVAGYMMALRGMKCRAVYFHAHPYTSLEAKEKVMRLSQIVGRYTMGLPLRVVSFTKVQQAIKEKAQTAWRTVLLRMAMMDCASALARYEKCKCLVTGESLSQVASQTVENITCTGSRSRLPVFRPLIGMDKEAIIRLSVSIGAYETSILPYEDCCVLFSPPHPVLRANLEEAGAIYESLNLQPLIKEAILGAEKY
ncbi:MAG: tRNA 4-thiouridine(8) synthase ThiI [Spirochaetaceae bacterium]|jgi:thiamine biosynthesis protein ThiI|nr:tRNA 4-thiouridine(8) synthase ThiI [Spirochaetaceae bacterium]